MGDVKDEKATKASSKATIENKTEKGEKADNIKASHTSEFLVTKANAPSNDDVKDAKATIESKTAKGEEADEIKAEKATKASSKATEANMTEKGEKADNIKASHTNLRRR